MQLLSTFAMLAVCVGCLTQPAAILAQPLGGVTAIEAAVLPLPEEMRTDATVKGLSESGEFATLRQGTNSMICLTDDPADRRFHVACYHIDLEAFMERGRALRAEGLDRDAVTDTRRREIEAGTLDFPEGPVALYSLTGDYDSVIFEDGRVHGATRLHVLYVPYATLESTGLPARAPRGQPWLMDPGEPWAHVMTAEVPAEPFAR
jgi:hypothetical protein